MPDFEPKDQDWDRKTRESFGRQSFLELLAVRILSLATGHCALVVECRPDMCQQHGFVHAGVTTTRADSAAGYAAFSLMPRDSSVLTAEFKLNLMAPAEGQSLIARAAVLKPGRTLTTVMASVHAVNAGRETQVAAFLGTMMCLHRKADGRQNA